MKEERTFIRRVGWTAFAVLFFVLYSVVAFRAPVGMFNSPDEMANHYFASRFAETGKLTVFEPLEEVAGGIVHPRSVAVVGNYLVPGSFHGLPIFYGLVGKLVGSGVMVFLTPFLAALALLAWRRIIGQTFGASAGAIAVGLLAITPAFWYYANRGLYHNMLFVCLLIFAAYFAIVRPWGRWFEKRKQEVRYDEVLAGLLLGSALWVRTAEVGWVAILVFVLMVCLWRYLSWRRLVLFVLAAIIPIALMFITNQYLYGHPFDTGYAVQNESLSFVNSNSAAPEQPSSLVARYALPVATITSILFPFGFHPRTAATNFITYFVMLPWWMTIMMVVALFWFGYQLLYKKVSARVLGLLLFFGGVMAWLALMYGSWVVHDNPDPDAITIGISYSRYWLPALVLGTGVAGVGWAEMTRRMPDGLRRPLLFVLMLALAAFSFWTVFFTKGDGIHDISETLMHYGAVKEDVLSHTPSEAVIIVDRGDKLFFPDRRVVTPFRDPAIDEIIPRIVLRAPLYYYGITMTTEDLRYHNDERLAVAGLELVAVREYGDHTLYEFKTKSHDTNISDN